VHPAAPLANELHVAHRPVRHAVYQILVDQATLTTPACLVAARVRDV